MIVNYFFIHKHLIIYTKIFNGRYILTFNITIPKIHHIEKLVLWYIIVNHLIQLVRKYVW